MNRYLTFAILFPFIAGLSVAQQKSSVEVKPATPAAKIAAPTKVDTIQSMITKFDLKEITQPKSTVGIKPATPPAKTATPAKTDTTQPRLKFNLKEMGFGAQGIGTSGCQYITIQNTTLESTVIKDISTPLSKIFTIPSPAKSMYPVTIQPKRTMTISICFVPDKPGDYKSKITIHTDKDSTVIPVWGKGVRPEDVAKLPKTDITTKPVKKGKEATITLQLVNQSKVILQVIDALGNVVHSYFNNEIVNPGNYDQNFDGTEKGGKKLEPGTFYARLIVTETNTNHEIKMTKRFEIK